MSTNSKKVNSIKNKNECRHETSGIDIWYNGRCINIEKKN